MKLVFTPDWFLGKDVMIDGFSFLVLLVFFIICIKNYKLNKNRKFLYLGSGFGLIALAQLASIFTKLVLYDYITFTQTIGQMILTYHVVQPANINLFYYAGFFFFRLFTLAGLYIIYRLPRKKKSFGDIVLGVFFIFVAAIFSYDYYHIFHLTSLVLLALIISNYYEVYKKNHLENTKMLILAFGILAFSQVIFLLSQLPALFVAGNIIELVSYLILLVLMIKILYYGKEKKQDGYSIGYTGYNPRKRRGN